MGAGRGSGGGRDGGVEGRRCGRKEVGQWSSLKSTRVGCSPPELGHMGELRSGQCGRGNRGEVS